MLIPKIFRFWERISPASQEILAGWFEVLWKTFEKEDRLGHTTHTTWYQTEKGLKLEGKQDDQSIYNVSTLQMPKVTKNREKFFPEISETTLAPGIFPDTLPEIETWKLDLKISDKTGKLKMPPIQFSKYRYHTPRYEQKHEISFADGKGLSSSEVKSAKSIYDAAIRKLNRN